LPDSWIILLGITGALCRWRATEGNFLTFRSSNEKDRAQASSTYPESWQDLKMINNTNFIADSNGATDPSSCSCQCFHQQDFYTIIISYARMHHWRYMTEEKSLVLIGSIDRSQDDEQIAVTVTRSFFFNIYIYIYIYIRKTIKKNNQPTHLKK